MAFKGPIAASPEQKTLRGNPGKRSIEVVTIKPDSTPPECPDWLDESAKEHWAELAPELIRLGLLTSVDGDSFAAYCQAYAEFQEATKILAEEGRVYSTTNGSFAAHPGIKMQRSALTAMKNFGAMFGLDPASRARLPAVKKEEEKDPFEEFLKNRN